MKNIALVLFICLTLFAKSQTRINGTFNFQTDPNKKYSLYIPSGYNPNVPSKSFVALHPWNTSRWDSESWCDTLINFAEANQLILICPDGGADGKVDDAIDTAFTSALLDSVRNWYSLDNDRIFAMGFSWGGLTTYTYGLSNPATFAGYMPIGAAINGSAPVNSIIANALNRGFYVIHGGNDNPSTRYTPLINALGSNGAILNSKLMPGIGHTIDFPNRNLILTDAFLWLDSVKTFQLAGFSINENGINSKVYPTFLKENETLITIEVPSKLIGSELQITDLSGQVLTTMRIAEIKFEVDLPESKGIYFVLFNNGKKYSVEKISKQ